MTVEFGLLPLTGIEVSELKDLFYFPNVRNSRQRLSLFFLFDSGTELEGFACLRSSGPLIFNFLTKVTKRYNISKNSVVSTFQ